MLLERLYTSNKALVNHCPRCDGLLLLMRLPFEDLELWSCAMCGNKLDATIIENRQRTTDNLDRNETARRFPVDLSTR